MPSHTAMRHFPGLDGLEEYGVVVLFDIGSDTFLLHPERLKNCSCGKTTAFPLPLLYERFEKKAKEGGKKQSTVVE